MRISLGYQCDGIIMGCRLGYGDGANREEVVMDALEAPHFDTHSSADDER